MSFVEALTNVIVGYCVAVATQIAVFPLFGLEVRLSDNLAIGAIFTGHLDFAQLLLAPAV